MIWFRRRALALFFGVLVLCPVAAHSQKFEGRQLIEAKLLADTATVVPGRPFTAGLLMKMAPGWHTYWQFPGDAGIPTEIKWNLPPGWKAGPIQWPIPLKLTEPGDIQIYGYHDEVLLMTQLTPPGQIGEKSVKLAGTANWLVCEKICIPGGAPVGLDLAVGAQTTPANAELFAKYRAQLPRPLPNASGALQWARRGDDLQLKVADKTLAQNATLDFFPLPEGTTVVGHLQREVTGDGSVIFTIPLDPASKGLGSLKGLLVWGNNAWSLGDTLEGRATSRPNSIQRPPAPNESGLGKLLLFGFLGGLILNLMPCVLPVISLKIFGFIQHAGDSRRRIFGNGLAFTLGIFAWFIGLALLMIALKSAGHEITWAFQFTNPYFVVAMSAVVLIFALNLFGVFEITLPAAATTGLLGWSTREGYAGSFFQGVFATVLATPCTAPYLGTALGFAFAQSAAIILLMFVAIAAGMSAPYLLLTAQPAWLRFLPRPGPWMVRVKQFMGFLLLATLLFLLWVLGAERGAEATIWVCAFLLALSLGCWMHGSFRTPAASFLQRSVVLVLMIVLVLAGGLYFLGEKFAAARLTTANSPGGDWIAFTPERVQSELTQGLSVFVDFGAAWCLTCKFNEATVLESAAVKSAFEHYSVVKMKADWTNADPVITRILKQFGRVGVPLYVLYPAGSPNQPIVLPELLTQQIVLQHLQTAAPKVAANK
jgi:thiol:disulfide interchange protein/DsbC/DsbD-like thiol-disulfide interchange protein